MCRPRVVHCQVEDYDVYIGRGLDPVTQRRGQWGNPFRLVIDGTREEVIEKFRVHVMKHPALVERIKSELRGKTLGCWCAPLPCHGDVLLEIANS